MKTNTDGTSRIFSEFLCDTDEPDKCDTSDTLDAPTEFFDTLDDALKKTAPQGSTVRAIGFEQTDFLLRAGYRLTDGDADIAIAKGGEKEFATARTANCRKLILCPTHSFYAAASSIYRTQDKTFAVMRYGQKPFAAVFDPVCCDGNFAAIFGEIVSLDLDAFDLTFGAYMRGERIPVDITAEVSALVTKLIAALKSTEKNDAEIKQVLVAAGKRAARITESTPKLLHASGAAQTAEALRMLHIAENRQIGMRGEIEMILGTYVIDFYIKSLTTQKPEFPPDNNKRIDSVCSYFRTDLRHACIHATPIYPPMEMRLREYRRDEFRHEQMKLLAELNKRHRAAWNVFKRLYSDDGFGIKSLIDKTDVGLCLALAPDVFATDSMLSFLKQTGRLEKYII